MRARAARLAALAGLLLFIALASTASAATATVNIQGFAFVQASVTINVGDVVTWTNKDAAAHSAVVNGVGQTLVLAQNQSGSLTFNTAGTFPYVCGIHGSAMTGTVIVRAAATAPPTQPPTLAPAPVPTARTTAPTIAPAPVPTLTASAAPTSAAPSASAVPSVAVVAPTQQAPAPAASNDGGASPLLIGGAVIAIIGLVAFALTRIRR